MTYNVFSGTLNLTQSINQSVSNVYLYDCVLVDGEEVVGDIQAHTS